MPALTVKQRLESKLHFKLERVCVAAAGRALRTKRAEFEMELPGTDLIDDEVISRLEAGAISKAEEAFDAENRAAEDGRRFYLQIEKPEIGRNSRIDSRYWLQSDTCHLQPDFVHGGVEAFHYLAWQEGRYRQSPASQSGDGGYWRGNFGYCRLYGRKCYGIYASICKAAVSPSFTPVSLLPPPARNSAEGAFPLISSIFSAISRQRRSVRGAGNSVYQ